MKIIMSKEEKLLQLIKTYPFYIFQNPSWPTVAVISYIVLIFTLGKWSKTKTNLHYILTIHNGFICILSICINIAVYWNIQYILNSQLLNSCSSSTKNTDFDLYNMFIWLELFYLTKYYELLDTIFLFLRKRIFYCLRMYHHSILVFTTWFFTRELIFMRWITPFNNLAVHVLMYFYYSTPQVELQKNIWWSKYMNFFQIIQFILDVCTSTLFPLLLFLGIECKGTLRIWFISNLIVLSFIVIYIKINNMNKEIEMKR